MAQPSPDSSLSPQVPQPHSVEQDPHHPPLCSCSSCPSIDTNIASSSSSAGIIPSKIISRKSIVSSSIQRAGFCVIPSSRLYAGSCFVSILMRSASALRSRDARTDVSRLVSSSHDPTRTIFIKIFVEIQLAIISNFEKFQLFFLPFMILLRIFFTASYASIDSIRQFHRVISR